VNDRAKDRLPGADLRGFSKSDLFLIAVLGLLINALLASRLQHPTYMDAYYYATNGQRLADGHGYTELIIWQFLDEPAGIPATSHTYWMPLASLLAAGGLKAWDQFRGMQMPFWILAGLLPLLSYFISHKLSGQRWQAWMAAMLTASGGFYVYFFNQPSTFAPFSWAGGLCLISLSRASQQPKSPWWWLVAGLTAGLGHLTRADGMLLLAVAVMIWVWRTWLLRSETGSVSIRRRQLSGIIWIMAGYLIPMGGWFVHNWRELGRLLPTVGTQTIFLTTYDDLFAYGRSFDLSHLFDWGVGNILRSKLQGLSIAGQTFVSVSCLIFLTPFVLWAWRRLGQDVRKRHWLRPMTWYALILFLAMSLIFTFPGGRGGLFHSSAALWPWFMALAAAGVDYAVEWFAVKFPHWQPERAKRIFAVLFVAVALIVSFAIGILRTPDESEAEIYTAIGRQLPDTAVVMVGNAPGFYYHTGLPAVSIPNEPVGILLQAADEYHVTHLVLDKDRPQPLALFYEGEIQTPDTLMVDEWDDYKLYKLSFAD
jgi:hypothetical protein